LFGEEGERCLCTDRGGTGDLTVTELLTAWHSVSNPSIHSNVESGVKSAAGSADCKPPWVEPEEDEWWA
jgi:hypothetical protein